MKVLAVAAVLLCCLSSHAKTCGNSGEVLQKADLILKNIKLYHVAEKSLKQAHISVHKDKISGVFWECLLPENLGEIPVTDLQGRVVTAGFSDLHVHNDGFQFSPTGTADDEPGAEAMAKRMLYSGVTSYLDLGSNPEKTMALRERSRQDAAVLPTIYATGGLFQMKGGHAPESISINVESPEQARRALADHVARWSPDMIKLVYDHNFHRPSHANDFSRMPKAILLALVETARRLNVKVVAHVGTWDDVRDAVEAGVSAITHIPYGDVTDEMVQLLTEQDISLITTMVAYMDLGFMQEPERKAGIFEHALLKAVALKDLILSYFDFDKYSDGSKKWTTWAIEHNKLGYRQRNFKKLLDGGVNIIPGTDSSLDGVFFGYSYHRELKLMVEFGATPVQALRMATVNAAHLMENNRGTVTPGAIADLLVYSDSPYEDINNSTSIQAILQNGQWVDLAKLKEELGVN